MLVSEAIKRIRSATHDITEEYTDVECVWSLNTAVHEISAALIAGRSPFMVNSGTFADGDSIPSGFFRTAGSYPIRITGSKIKFLNDSTTMAIRYFAMPTEVTGINDDDKMPFDIEPLNELAIRIAVKQLSDENEFDISQDSAIQQELQSVLQQGLAG